MITRTLSRLGQLESNSGIYNFFVRVSGDDIRKLKEAHRKAKASLGDDPSNPVLLSKLLDRYLEA